MPYSNPERAKEAKRQWYLENRAAHVARAGRRNERVRGQIRDLIMAHLAAHPCIDCGETDPIVLEFDHREDKAFSIALARSHGYPIGRVEAEITKCDVRCCNCHRRRTYHQLNHRSRCLGESEPRRFVANALRSLARGRGL